MKKIVRSSISAALLAMALNAGAQDRSFTKFSKQDLIDDTKLGMEILKKQHPNPYKFIDSVSYQRKVDSLLQKMAEQPDVFACNQFSPIGLLRDVHTSLAYSDENSRDLYSKINALPISVIIEREKMLVNVRGLQVPFGSEIISIDGLSTEELIRFATNLSYSDGWINTGIDRAYGDFQTRFSLRNVQQKTYEVTFRVPGSKDIKKATLPAATPAQAFHTARQSVMPVNQLQRAHYVYSDFQPATQTGILTVNSFNLQEAYAYKEFSEFFRELNRLKYKNVIIDIRSNGGGNPAISALLYSFLTAKPFRNEYNYRTRTIDMTYAEYAVAQGRVMSEEDIRNNKNFLYQRFDKDSASGFYIGNARLKEGQLENFPPDKDAFNGNVYVLTGGGTVSAATYFAALVQRNKRGLIVGKETGSGEQSTTAAWFLTYQLPNTKSILTVPMSELYFFNSTADNGRGVLPDRTMPIEKFVSYVRESQDPEVSYTLELISSKK